VGGNDDGLDGVVEWITHEPGIEVVGRAHDGLGALDLSESLRAELVLADVTLPDMSGFDLMGRIKALPWAPLVVLLSFHDSKTARDEARATGADHGGRELVDHLGSRVRKVGLETATGGRGVRN